jgi:hypothetical protein
MGMTDDPSSIQQMHPTGERRAELERIKAATWPPDEPEEVRRERIRAALEAFNARPRMDVDPQTLKWIMEGTDAEDAD